MEMRDELVWLRPPVEPGAHGARGSWRAVSRWLPHERRKGAYWERTSRDEAVARLLLEQRRQEIFAYVAAQRAAEQGLQPMGDPTAGQDSFGDVATAWFEHQVVTAPWGASQRKAQRSLLKTWLVSPDIVVPRSVRASAEQVPLRDIAIRDLTPNHLDHALDHVYRLRAHATYLKVRQQLRTIFTWARANGLCPPQVDPAAALRRLPSRSDARNLGKPIAPAKIPTSRAVEELARCSVELTGQWWRALEIRLLALCGMRIGELLGIRNAPELWEIRDGQLWLLLRTQWNGGPLKSRETRWIPIPASLAQDLQRRRQEVTEGGHLFCAPNGGAFDPNNWRSRIFDPAAARAGWPERADYCADHRDHADSDCRMQDTRRWQHPPHSLRHLAVTLLMSNDALDDDDIAVIVGHTNGAQLRRMYKQTRPEAEARISRVYASM